MALQVEIDYKAECVAGDKVDCLGTVLSGAEDIAATNGSGAPPLPTSPPCWPLRVRS